MDSSFLIVRNRTFHILLFLILTPLLFSCSPQSDTSGNNIYEITINGKKLHVEVAFTQKERTIGLMFRDQLEKDHGMLFIYPQEQYMSFWMKNTKIPLSIAFINSREIITQLDTMAPYSLAGHASKEKVRFALEMEEGWFSKNGIEVGSKVDFPPEIRSLYAE